MKVVKAIISILLINVLFVGCNEYVNSGEMNPSEIKDMYKEYETKFTKRLSISTNDYYISNLEDFSNVAMQHYEEEEYNILNEVFVKAFFREDYDRSSPSIIYISKELDEIIISFLDTNNIQVNTYLVHDDNKWKVTTNEIKTH